MNALDRPGRQGARVRIVSVEVSRDRASQLRVTVTLARGGATGRGEAGGVGSDMVQMRLAAQATLSAVGELLERPVRLRLIGVKRVHAFDADLVLVGLKADEAPAEQLVGSVPIEGDAIRAATAATLDAINRILSRREPRP